MKIHLNRMINNNPYQNQQQKQAAMKQEKQIRQDKVEISSAAKEMQASNPVHKERIDKVNQIKHQVETGAYHVDTDHVASKMRQFFR